MPRIQVYLPEELYSQVKRRGLPASELLQKAVRAEVRRRDLLDEGDRYIAELMAEVGEPRAEDRAWAEALVRRVTRRRKNRAG